MRIKYNNITIETIEMLADTKKYIFICDADSQEIIIKEINNE